MPQKKKSTAPQPPQRRTMAGEDAFRVWLRQLCEALTYKAVAKKAGVSPSQLSNLVSGRSSLGAKTVARFRFKRVDTVTFIPMEDDEK